MNAEEAGQTSPAFLLERIAIQIRFLVFLVLEHRE
jgi:hypothetical protein